MKKTIKKKRNSVKRINVKFKCERCGNKVNDKLSYYKGKKICQDCWEKLHPNKLGYQPITVESNYWKRRMGR